MLGFVDGTLYETLPYALVGLGIVLTYRYLRLIDLTFAASFVLGPAVGGSLLIAGAPFWTALLAALVAVLLLGAMTLLLMWLLEIDGLLAGLLSSFTGFSISLLFTQGTLSLHAVQTPLDLLKAVDYSWLDGVVPLHPTQIATFLLVVLTAKFLVDRFLGSELGLAFRAMEDQRSRAFILASIEMSELRMFSIGVVLGNVLCGAAGMIVMLKEGQVTANRGFDALIAVIAAYLLGTALFERRLSSTRSTSVIDAIAARIATFSPTAATILGLLFYFVLTAAMARVDVPASVPRLLMVGLIVISFLVSKRSEMNARWFRTSLDKTQVSDNNSNFEAFNINIEYPGNPSPNKVIRDGRLTIPRRAVVELRGPNGSGKSTLLRYLAGLNSGTGRVVVPTTGPAGEWSARSRIPLVGYISQQAYMASSDNLSTAENLALFSAGPRASPFRRWRDRATQMLPDRIAALLKSAGGLSAASLSGGQRQILGIASVVLRPTAPSIILFDEPLTHLDEPNAAACVDLIEELASKGHTIVIVQHDLGDPALGSTGSRARLVHLITQSIEITDVQGQPLQ